jgi:hypothetical protein
MAAQFKLRVPVELADACWARQAIQVVPRGHQPRLFVCCEGHHFGARGASVKCDEQD